MFGQGQARSIYVWNELSCNGRSHARALSLALSTCCCLLAYLPSHIKLAFGTDHKPKDNVAFFILLPTIRQFSILLHTEFSGQNLTIFQRLKLELSSNSERGLHISKRRSCELETGRSVGGLVVTHLLQLSGRAEQGEHWPGQ